MNYTYSDELYHFGIRGMKWGIRRYQNEDGTLTEEGRIHYGRVAEKGFTKSSRNSAARILKTDSEYKEYLRTFDETLKQNKKYRKGFEDVSKMPENTKEERAAKIKAQDKYFDDMIKAQEAESVNVLKDRSDNLLLNKYGDKKISELSDFYNSTDYTNASDVAADFYERSVKESGDWYSGKGVSDNFKKYVDNKNKLRDAHYDRITELHNETESKFPNYREDAEKNYNYFLEGTKYYRDLEKNDTKLANIDKQLKKNGDKVVDIVIKDLGYIPTKKARKALDPLIRWD